MAKKPVTWFRCMHCGYTWEALDEPSQERVCLLCKSNSVRKLRKPPQ